MTRQQQILTALLVVQVVVASVVFWPRRGSTAAASPLLAGVAADDIVGLTISDDQGSSLVLRKQDEQWVLPEAEDYPVQASKVEPVLEGLANMDRRTLVARTKESQRQLQVADDDYARRLVLTTSAGQEQGLYLGSAPSYGATHVRLVGEAETYLQRELSAWEVAATASSWIDVSYLRIAADELTEVIVQNAGGTLRIVRDEAGEWTLADLAEGEVLAEYQVSALVSSASNLTVREPLGKTGQAAYGLDEPLAVATLRTATEAYIVNIGAHDPDGRTYVVKASNSDYYVTVSDYSLRNLVEDSRSDLLEQPTPTPAA